MEPHFAIDVDPVRHLVRTRLAGFFTDDAVERYLAARAIAFARLRCPVPHHLALTDLREMRIQAQDIVARFGGVLADPSTRARRIAFVTGGTLTRKQLFRAIGARDAAFFTDPEEAERWLLTREAAHAA